MSKIPTDAKILYLGTPEMSAVLLKGMAGLGYNIVGVITNVDKPTGRKGTLTPPPVKVAAMELGIPVYQPVKMRLEWEFAKELDFDVIITFAYGQIVPEGFLNLASKGAYNFHGSILPKYRGAAPIQRAIMDGLEETGVSLMEMVAAMDAGRVYAIEKFPIEGEDDYGTICRKMAEASIKLAETMLPDVIGGTNQGVPQDESLVTIARKIKKEDEVLPAAELSAKEAWCYVRGLSPTPGAYVYLGEKKLKIYKCYPVEDIVLAGTFKAEKSRLLLGCKEGSLVLEEIQLEGKGRSKASDFLNGHRNLFL